MWRHIFGFVTQEVRSAPLNMMLMDVEEQLKTRWKQKWRKAITGKADV